mmetsp:Transcript_34634/g.76146  ORF Transcript_34634/g.76146 Transcript_34634/m.76146 type:complete len:218 (-) Transcript_34634:438-1091(-)
MSAKLTLRAVPQVHSNCTYELSMSFSWKPGFNTQGTHTARALQPLWNAQLDSEVAKRLGREAVRGKCVQRRQRLRLPPSMLRLHACGCARASASMLPCSRGKSLLCLISERTPCCQRLTLVLSLARAINRLHVRPHEDLLRHLLEASGFGVELWSLHELQEQVREALAQSRERRFGTASVQHVRLAVDQFDDIARQVAVKLLHSPLDVEEHVEPLVD